LYFLGKGKGKRKGKGFWDGNELNMNGAIQGFATSLFDGF
jgi:hypothetical protein